MPAAASTNCSEVRPLQGGGWIARARQFFEALESVWWIPPNPRRIESPWQRFWGGTYGPGLKRWLFKPVFEKLEEEGKIGDLIVDAGCGASPVTDLLAQRAGRKRILIDIAAENEAAENEQRIRMDVQKIAAPGSLSLRKALLRARRFLGAGPDANRACVDAIVLSDILNYVDYKLVLGGFAEYLKPGGGFIIVNMPARGNDSLFSHRGVKDNRDLCRFLEANGFEIEHKAFPKRPRGETIEEGELIVLVARKREG
jgi:SAM-dependent methyltransferase